MTTTDEARALIAKLKTLWDFEYSHHETDSTAISVDDLEETIEVLRSLADEVDG